MKPLYIFRTGKFKKVLIIEKFLLRCVQSEFPIILGKLSHVNCIKNTENVKVQQHYDDNRKSRHFKTMSSTLNNLYDKCCVEIVLFKKPSDVQL